MWTSSRLLAAHELERCLLYQPTIKCDNSEFWSVWGVNGRCLEGATRQLVYRLTNQFILPVVILTDCDPYGFEIALTYKFGSLAMAWAPERLAVPSAIWLGQFSPQTSMSSALRRRV